MARSGRIAGLLTCGNSGSPDGYPFENIRVTVNLPMHVPAMTSSTGFEILRSALAHPGSADEDSPAVHALRYAHLGLPVFPCMPGGKKHLTRNGFHAATMAVARVRRWWERAPQANIGIPTGAASGLLVVDVDVHAGRSGFRAFDRARSAGLADGVAWLVRTPSGGLHAYYPADPRREQRSWQSPSAHIDFRGDGGYIIAPPLST